MNLGWLSHRALYKVLLISGLAVWLSGCQLGLGIDELDYTSFQPIQTLMCDTNPFSVAWSNNGDFLACGEITGRIVVWSAADWEIHSTLHQLDSQVISIRWSADDNYFSALSEDETLYLWRVDEFRYLGSQPVEFNDPYSSYDSQIMWHPDLPRVAVIPSRNGRLEVFNVPQLQSIFSMEISTLSVLNPVLSPNMRYLSTISKNEMSENEIVIQEMQTGRILSRLSRWSFYDVAWNPNSPLLAIAESYGELRLWDAINAEVLSIQIPLPMLRALHWSPSGSWLAVVTEPSDSSGHMYFSVQIIDNEGNMYGEFPLPSYLDVTAAEWSSDSSLFVFGVQTQYDLRELVSFRSGFYVIDMQSGSTQLVSIAISGQAELLAWSPTENILALLSGISSDTITLWEFEE